MLCKKIYINRLERIDKNIKLLKHRLSKYPYSIDLKLNPCVNNNKKTKKRNELKKRRLSKTGKTKLLKVDLFKIFKIMTLFLTKE